MNKLISYLIVLFLLLSAVSALQIEENEDEVLIETEVNENLYAAGGKVSIEAPVNGDITAFGGEVNLNSEVEEDVMAVGGKVNLNSAVKGGAHACGGEVNINSVIGGDLMSGGGEVNVNGEVGGDLRVVGGNININDAVGGDILAAGGSINIKGPVGGDIAITAGEVIISGVIEGNVKVTADKIELKEDALIKGNLSFKSEKDPILKSEQVEGKILREVIKKKAMFNFGKVGFKIYAALAILLLGIVIVLIAPNLTDELSNSIKKKFGKSLLFGLLALIVTPIAAALIAITIIGIPITIILILLYVLALFLSGIIAVLYLGKLFFKKKPKNLVLPMIAGIVVYVILLNIPFIGVLVKLLAIILGLGAITMALFSKKKR